MVAVATFPPLVAVTFAVPAATPLTTPALLTVATDAALDDQVTLAPLMAAPAASFAIAVSWVVPASATLAVAGVSETLATGAGLG